MPGPASFEPPVRKGRGKLIVIGAVVTTLLLAVAGGLLFFLFMGKAPAFPDDYYLKPEEFPSGLRQSSLSGEWSQDAAEFGMTSNPGCSNKIEKIEEGLVEEGEMLEGMVDSFCFQVFYAQGDSDDEVGYMIYKFKTPEEMDRYWSWISETTEVYDENLSDDRGRRIYLLDRDNNVAIWIWSDASSERLNREVFGITNALAGRIEFEDKRMT